MLGSLEVGDIEARSGIRKGCTGSPWLFVMVMKLVIEHVMLTGLGFCNTKFRIPLLMFADDGLLLAHSAGEMRSLIRSVNEVSLELGMKINKEKKHSFSS